MRGTSDWMVMTR